MEPDEERWKNLVEGMRREGLLLNNLTTALPQSRAFKEGDIIFDYVSDSKVEFVKYQGGDGKNFSWHLCTFVFL
jgi:hypothetical protein